MDYQEVIEWINERKLSRCENCLRKGNEYCGGNCRIENEVMKIAISAMQELQEYKQLGTLEEVREAVEKQKKKKPRASNRCYVCPRCGLVTSLKIKHNYCDACGQHIDWRKEESPEPYHPDKCHGCFGAENNDCEGCADGNKK